MDNICLRNRDRKNYLNIPDEFICSSLLISPGERMKLPVAVEQQAVPAGLGVSCITNACQKNIQ